MFGSLYWSSITNYVEVNVWLETCLNSKPQRLVNNVSLL